MTFWGYNSYKEALKYWAKFGLEIEDANVQEINVCSLDKKCVGYFDDQTYTYEDGSKDSGRFIKKYTVIIGDNKICWSDGL